MWLECSETLNLAYFTCLEGSARLNLLYFTCLEDSGRFNLSCFTCRESSWGLNLSYFTYLEGTGGFNLSRFTYLHGFERINLFNYVSGRFWEAQFVVFYVFEKSLRGSICCIAHAARRPADPINSCPCFTLRRFLPRASYLEIRFCAPFGALRLSARRAPAAPAQRSAFGAP